MFNVVPQQFSLRGQLPHSVKNLGSSFSSYQIQTSDYSLNY
jgi:hypothetical protein